eukprot:9956752-Alexandrium_andersonii.AAC.1
MALKINKNLAKKPAEAIAKERVDEIAERPPQPSAEGCSEDVARREHGMVSWERQRRQTDLREGVWPRCQAQALGTLRNSSDQWFERWGKPSSRDVGWHSGEGG